MDSFTLSGDEAILHRTQTIIISGVRNEAVLTSSRLILADRDTGQIHEEIPFADIGLAASGVNRIREPVITISFNSPDGERRTLELIFIRLYDSQNIRELERCISILKEHDVPVEIKSPLTGPARSGRGERTSTGELIVEDPVIRPAVPDWIIFGASGNNKKSLPLEEPIDRTPIILLTAAILILAVIIGGISLKGPMLEEKTTLALQDKTPSAATKGGTPSSGTSPAPVPASQVPSVPPDSLPAITIPASGVWVQVQYPGNFSGSIGARGRNIEVSGSGTKWYQVPVVDPTLDGTITKLDGSGDKMLVEIYKDGKLISRKSTTSPRGFIELLGAGTEALTSAGAANIVEPTLVPIPEIQLTEDYLSPVTIPATGVWVRVYYPGSFSGSIGGRGLFTPVKNTGDQLYSIPANVGIVEGSFEKNDASAGKMTVEVYKDGTRLSQMVTTKPKGLIDVHVPV